MSEKTLISALYQILRPNICADKVTICWHAGEPLAVERAFYDTACELCEVIRPPDLAVTHSMQTNGLLIDDTWCTFFKKNNFRVGVSVDGPKRVHDKQRITRKGAGTHDRVMKGIRKLQSANVDFSVITVLTIDSLTLPDEFFWFFVENGIKRVAFNIEELEGHHRLSSVFTDNGLTLFKRFMSRLYALCIQNPGLLSVREFVPGLLVKQNGKFDRPPNQQNLPLAIISIAENGDFSTFSPELLGYKDRQYGDFILGNVNRDDLSEALVKPEFAMLAHDISVGVERCRIECDYFAFCGGGAPANKYFELGSFASSETNFCRFTKKAIIDVLLEAAEQPAGLMEEFSAI
jgi:uncharacterized protein